MQRMEQEKFGAQNEKRFNGIGGGWGWLMKEREEIDMMVFGGLRNQVDGSAIRWAVEMVGRAGLEGGCRAQFWISHLSA